ncbi:T9SS type A sorting domain-containing protein [uncultured Flavobacterium sp.]|jgi:hypothetical protein|uniref:T9SS type A sorting domain-containing protein n=1 Tax=uncultured Flavobacterium sp. TaxID=165435 RepID=UPI002591F30F|nr:T9SS type A sorting domain-containing protein [uncultured Flavobacterium sp.]
MKKVAIIIVVFVIQTIGAQTINFPDVNFKNALLNLPIDYDGNGTVFPMIDANNDGEITQAEAQLVQKLSMSYAELNNLSGLQYFTNLKSFESLFFNATSFNFPTLVNLQNLTLSNAVTAQYNINNLDLSSNVNLKTVSCATSATAVNVNNLDQLTNLTLSGNFTTLNINDATDLLFLNITAPLNTLDLSNNTRLININLSNTNCTTFDLSACLNLEIIQINYGEMQTLNLGNIKHVRYLFLQDNKLTTLNANNLFNLEFIYCQNNQLTNLFLENGIIEQEVDFTGNPNLAAICCDANEIVYMQNECNILGYTASIASCATSVAGGNQVTMFPNPVQDVLHLDAATTIQKVEFYASNGLLIMTSTTASSSIDMQSFPAGLYFVKVYNANEVTQMKFIKS